MNDQLFIKVTQFSVFNLSRIIYSLRATETSLLRKTIKLAIYFQAIVLNIIMHSSLKNFFPLRSLSVLASVSFYEWALIWLSVYILKPKSMVCPFSNLKYLQFPPGAACLLLNSDLPKHIFQQSSAGVTACVHFWSFENDEADCMYGPLQRKESELSRLPFLLLDVHSWSGRYD